MAYFSDAHLKLDRASHHIGRLESLIGSLTQSDLGTVEVNPELGNQVIKHDIPNIVTAKGDIALIAGDAFHNLRCALDYAWIETITVLAPQALNNFGKFPVYPTHNDLESALRGHGIEESSRELFRVILDKIKPHAKGNHAIWPVHRLDIRDKHRLLIPTVLYASVSEIETQDQTGEISRGGFAASHQEPPWYIPISPGVTVVNKGMASITVSFDYGSEEYESVFADSLQVYAKPILGVVQMLEALI